MQTKDNLLRQSILTEEEEVELSDINNNIESLKCIIEEKENEFNSTYSKLVQIIIFRLI